MTPTRAQLLSQFLDASYTATAIQHINQFLCESGVFDFDVFPTGLFPAVGSGTPTERTSGYRAVWVRDNVHVAYAHLVAGDVAAAVRNGLALASFFLGQRHRFGDIISKKKSARDPMNRPHIRFDGENGKEIDERWPHAQNDALGAFLWFFCILALRGDVRVTADQAALLADVVRYFRAIEYWRDEDSGHWEEQRKISASSIGAVNAGIERYRELLSSPGASLAAALSPTEVDELLATGVDAMTRILPSECVQPDPLKQRRYDAALLFLIDPLDVVDAAMADRIIADVTTTLQGEYGISRYPEDSYWGPDYRCIPEEKRTIDLSEDIIERSDYAVKGKEAEWCIFDSVLSVIYGKRYLETLVPNHLALQTAYFNRALSQLVESPAPPARLLLPEAYFVENGRYVPNDHIPLQWAQANLWRCVRAMVASLDRRRPTPL